MWWTLPAELVENVVSFLSFSDYVALTQTSSALRLALDCPLFFQCVIKANYGKLLEAYQMPIVESLDKLTVWHATLELRSFLATLRSSYPSAGLEGQSVGSVIPPQVLGRLACEPKYVIPVLEELGQSSQIFDELKDDKSLTAFSPCPISDPSDKLTDDRVFPVAPLAWTRQLLHLQNFTRAVCFFLENDPAKTADIERCFFEISRCYLDFTLLATSRTRFLKASAVWLQELLPFTTGSLHFPSVSSYKMFLHSLIICVWPHLSPSLSDEPASGNILHVYARQTTESPVLYHAVVAKVLQDVVFSKISFVVAGASINTAVSVSPAFLIIGDYWILMTLGSSSVSIYEKRDLSRLPAASMASALTPLTYADVIERVFHLDSPAVPLSRTLASRNWTLAKNSSEKLRFLRTILKEIANAKSLLLRDFSPLLRSRDFFLYYYCATRLIAPNEEADTLGKFPAAAIPKGVTDFEYVPGDLVIKENYDYVGIVMNKSQGFLTILPHDNAAPSIASPESVRLVNNGDMHDVAGFLHWLLSTEGMIYACMYFYPAVQVRPNGLRFIL